MTMQRRDRGAAMVIAISIMTILLAIALTFFAVTRRELQVATNVTNTVRVDHLADAAMAIAVAHLNQDVFKNPRATSLDHAAFAIFNGAWIAGKPWAMRNNIPLWQGGIPEINLNRLPFPSLAGVQQPLYVRFEDGHIERLYLGARSRDWLFYPRVEHRSGSPAIDRPVLFDPDAKLLDANFVELRIDQYPNLCFRYDPSLLPGQSLGWNRPPDYFPFVNSDYYGRVLSPDGNPYVMPGGDPLFPIPDAEFNAELGGDGGAQYPLEQIHAWADVDNDGDGRRDSMWIPIPLDVFFPDDGIDNNLSGNIFDEPSPGVFVYWGGDDGLDNNGNGIVDGPDEQKYFLTAPLPGLVIPVDLYSTGFPGTKVIDLDDGIEKSLWVKLPPSITVRVLDRNTPFLANGAPNIIEIALTNADVDVLDNDYNMIVNDFYVYAYIGPNPYLGAPYFDGRNANDDDPLFAGAKVRGYTEINAETVLGFDNLTFFLRDFQSPFPNDKEITGVISVQIGQDAAIRQLNPAELARSIKITHSGEPVCELVGRAAILIRDEASKVNLNVAGGHSYTGNPDTPMRRALGEGATPHEYETRVLPQVQFTRASKMWGVLTGSPAGAVLPVSTAQADYLGAPGEDPARATRLGPYYWDLSFPGYGRVDDNANALILAFSGRDDSGSGLIDEGLFLPDLSPEADGVLDGVISWTDVPVNRRDAVLRELSLFKLYFDRLGLLEGIDEPAELQRFRPRRNLLAERDGIDNDLNGVAGEFGELGDRQLQNLDQIQQALSNEGPQTINLANRLRNFATVHSTDRNAGYIDTARGLRAVSRLDFNLATPQQIAAHLIIHGDFSPVTRLTDEMGDFLLTSDTLARRFAEGLRQADIGLRAPGGLLNGTVESFPADPLLQALELAVDIVDSRDNNHARSVLTTEKTKLLDITKAPEPGDPVLWPERLTARESIPQTDLLPLEEIEEHMVNTLGMKDATGYVEKPIQALDQWWDNLVDPPQARRISYTAAGTEAIRINEIMVRAVRRVEAEAIPDPSAMSVDDPMLAFVPPESRENFNPSPGGLLFPEFALTRRELQRALGTFSVDPPGAWQVAGAYLGESGFVNGAGGALFLNVPNPAQRAVFPVRISEVPPVTIPVPRVMQFVFQATEPFDPANPAANRTPEGLPPGRYYLTMKAYDAAKPVNDNSLRPGDILYAIKYVRTGVQDIVGDISQVIGQIRGELPGLPVLPPEALPQGYFANNWKTLEDWQTAKMPGAPQGWVFLDCGPSPATDPGFNLDYFGEFYNGQPQPATPHPTFPYTHTVMIPPHDSGWALCVAVCPNPDIPIPVQLSVDLFDFSQEPDHEYVEIVNISDNIVDLRGWTLEVGIPDRPLVPADPFKSTWRIPDGTQPVEVEPGGKLLLAFNVQDNFFNASALNSLISANGIGLARNFWVTGDVTVPPIFDTFTNTDGSIGSVFDRTPSLEQLPEDYTDLNGNGAGILEGAPWSRMVQLENVLLPWDEPLNPGSVRPSFGSVFFGPDEAGLARLAQLVLRGGIFPNYPERDGYDNDGDGGYVTDPVDFSGVLSAFSDGQAWINAGGQTRFYTRYVPGALDLDMVDNNLDGLIDERGSGLVNYAADPVNFTALLGLAVAAEVNLPGSGNWSFMPNVMLSEGVDEGRAGYGAYAPGILPLVFLNNADLYKAVNYYDEDLLTQGLLAQDASGAIGLDARIQTPAARLDEIGAITRLGDPADPAVIPAPYLGSEADPPDWKAYVERRWNPGDSVIVTLYTKEGSAADRVTYREYDVVNRTIDDQVVCPYVDGDGIPVLLHPDYPTFWPPDQMGLDFYRSLERKDPLYKGDRFGTVNRWQATDGNYDDWTESPSFYERVINTATSPPTVVRTDYRFDTVEKQSLFRHTVWGSPLRMNLPKRISANPGGQFPSANTPSNFAWSHAAARLADRPHESPGSLLQIPRASYLHEMFNLRAAPDRFLYDMTQLNLQKQIPGVTGTVRQDTTGRGVVFGTEPADLPWQGEALGQVLEIMTQNPLVLSVGQAQFTPIRPNPFEPNTPGGQEWQEMLRWRTEGGLRAPAAWTPIFLFASSPDIERSATGNDTGRFPYYPAFPDGRSSPSETLVNPEGALDALFNPLYLLRDGAVNSDYLLPRWSLERRAVMYWSQPRPEIDPPEALFTWDADDGLENGEYMVYIGTFLPAMQERLANANRRALEVETVSFGEGANTQTINGLQEPLLTEFGADIFQNIAVYAPELAIEIITDRTRARGLAAGIDLPGLTPPAQWTSGMVYRPGSDGYILYGNKGVNSWRPQLVHVRDNFLALRVRNIGTQAAVITQVVLAPRKRVPGKINVNTITERVIRDQGTEQMFNTLLGLPGIVDARNPWPPADSLDPITRPIPGNNTANPWPSLSELLALATPPQAVTVEQPADNLASDSRRAGAQLAAMIQAGRPEYVDGRYYTNIGDLVRDASQFVHRYPDGSPSGSIHPLSNRSRPDQRFEDILERFRRMANLITVRSDVFEIIVTVQAGYGIDLDADGHYNYRSDEEFVVTAEAKSRIVYERRSPGDRSDQAEPEVIAN